MTAQPNTAPDPRPSPRLTGVDAARGLALIGMMAVHVLPNRDLDGSASLSSQLAGGRSAAAFAVCAGVGLALATPRPGRWIGLLVRAVVVGGVGLALGHLDSGIAVILPYYAVLFVLAVPLLRLSGRVLAGLAVGGAVVMPVLSHLVRPHLPPPGRANPTVDSLVSEPGHLLVEVAVTGYYPVTSWLVYLCAGMAAGRLIRADPDLAGRWLLALGLWLAGVGWFVATLLLEVAGGARALAADLGVTRAALDRVLDRPQFGTTPTTTWWWLTVDAPHSSTPFDLLHTTGTALAAVGAGLLVARVAPRGLLPLAAAGSMTFTLYTAHVLVEGSPYAPTNPENSFVLQVVAVVCLAMLWRTWFRRGPLEAVTAGAGALLARQISSSRSATDSTTREGR